MNGGTHPEGTDDALGQREFFLAGLAKRRPEHPTAALVAIADTDAHLQHQRLLLQVIVQPFRTP